MRDQRQNRMQELGELLRRHDHKLTGPRRLILRVLAEQTRPMTSKEIFQALRSPCDLVTVYRSVRLLEAMGLVKRFDFGDGAARFELLADRGEHHHHLICTECDAVIELDECLVEGLEATIGSRNGFTRVTHKLEFFGVCPRCQ